MNRQQQLDRFLLEAHRFALRRSKETPDRMSPPGRPKGEYRRAQHQGTPADAVRLPLARWRDRAGVTRSDADWDEWQRLLDGDLDALERAALLRAARNA